MSMTKRYLEQLSVQMGFGGEINDEVLTFGKTAVDESYVAPSLMDTVEVATCVGCNNSFCYKPSELHSTPDLCRNCATIALEDGLSSYNEFLSTSAVSYYVSAFGTAIPFPTEPPEGEAE